MKKLVLLAVLVAVFAAFASSSQADEMKWSKEIVTDKGQLYEVIYKTQVFDSISCAVIVSADSKLDLFASDSNWNGKYVGNWAHLHVHANSWYLENEVWTVDNGPLNLNSVHDGEGYHVFSNMCVEAAKSLPREVRLIFNGVLGIE